MVIRKNNNWGEVPRGWLLSYMRLRRAVEGYGISAMKMRWVLAYHSGHRHQLSLVREFLWNKRVAEIVILVKGNVGRFRPLFENRASAQNNPVNNAKVYGG